MARPDLDDVQVGEIDPFHFDPADLAQATRDAKKHPPSKTTGIRYTEQNPHYVCLYNEARQGQFDPETIKKMSDDWLIYLDGHQEPHESLSDSEDGRLQASKLGANARRAHDELQRRFEARQAALARRWALRVAMIAAVVGGLVGALVRYV